VHFDLLARDVLANVEALRALSAVDPDRIGVMGVSQAGWILPIAASRDPRLAFAVVLSGPAVTVGEESLFSSLTRDMWCGRDGLPVAAADELVREVGPSGFDPRPYLEAMSQPSLWIYGLADIHQPSLRSVDILEELQARGKDLEVRTFERANHFLATDGPCGDRPVVDWLPATLDWLEAQLSTAPAMTASAR
jgi:dipeptidyl aminopeptidase/acylaminoacyl peptidase